VKTSTSYKVRLIELACKQGTKVRVRIRGGERYDVLNLANAKHSLILTVQDDDWGKPNPYVCIDPDDLLYVWVDALPPSFE
jgi:methionyl-tRNA synthetase